MIGSVGFENTIVCWFRVSALLGCLAVMPTALAQTVELSPSIERLAAEAGAVVTRDAKGDLESVVLRRNGVVISSDNENEFDAGRRLAAAADGSVVGTSSPCDEPLLIAHCSAV